MTAVSIVVPVLDEAARLPGLLAGFAAWRDAGDEVVVVDGGSRDDSVAAARPWCDVVVTAARGRAAQMNAGAAVARGRVLWFVHADSDVAAVAREVVAGCTAWGRCDVRLDDRAPVFRVIEFMMNQRSRLTGIATGDQALFVTRELFTAVGGFPELALMEDVEISARLRRRARPLCTAGPVLTSARRWRRHGIARTVALMWWLRLAWFCGVDDRRLARWYGQR
ncbi:MAG: TIGR04283 family arsenosugar biosynthesis glycosyltransferase [Gammaproteobacteria bacterium]|nr:TIGR04283 family arsenosugar biosynthesis glycosyltransferase [Gammaproteobacteria bacterium]MCP5202316.1 TIGR04283 family arsenosugar biosynthesis glycosyltransferase [Gammaproteobacteria bacterium]